MVTASVCFAGRFYARIFMRVELRIERETGLNWIIKEDHDKRRRS